MRIFLSKSGKKLRQKLSQFERTVTVEAEYGEEVVEGTLLTVAHHGPRSGQVAPCLCEFSGISGVQAIGVSHLDLDCLGCLLHLMQPTEVCSSDERLFWNFVALIDVHGQHREKQLVAYACREVEVKYSAEFSRALQDTILRKYHAYCAWEKRNRIRIPERARVIEVTDHVLEAMEALKEILKGESIWIFRGIQWASDRDFLNSLSYVGVQGDVVLRRYPHAVTDLFETPDGRLKRGVVSFNTESQEVFLSIVDPSPDTSCLEIAQRLWGKAAVGNKRFSRSPIGKRLGEPELLNAARALSAVL